MEKSDADGNTTLLKMWHSAGDDLYGQVARDERLVDDRPSTHRRATPTSTATR